MLMSTISFGSLYHTYITLSYIYHHITLYHTYLYSISQSLRDQFVGRDDVAQEIEALEL